MPVATVPTTGLDLWYETFGDPGDEPLLLVMGLGAQAIAWDTELCLGFVDRGFFVIRFDNRDTGLSSKIDAPEPLDVQNAMSSAFLGEAIRAPYLLSDMAADAVGLLDVLGIDAAHVVGASMGGMIAQAIAIEHPGRVRTLTSIMSTTGDPDVGIPSPEAMQQLLNRPPDDREGNIAHAVVSSRVIGSPDHFDEDRARARAADAYDRCFHPLGVGRQLLAIMASGSRTEALRNLDVPTLVLHGDADPLVAPSGGERTAEAIPGAELVLLEGMGHDLPPVYWARIIEAVTALAARSNAGG